jgi:hypothetical protein
MIPPMAGRRQKNKLEPIAPLGRSKLRFTNQIALMFVVRRKV